MYFNMKKIHVTIKNRSCHKMISPTNKDLIKWVTYVCNINTTKADITIVIVNTEEMIKLNKKYRNINKNTNILTFSYGKNNIKKQYCIGDLILCNSKIKEESIEQKKKLKLIGHILLYTEHCTY